VIRVRVDDFPHTSKREPQHTLKSFLEFHKVLSHGIGHRKYLLGVVPGQCTIEDILFLRQNVDCVVGMHGTDHDEQRLDRNAGNQFEPYLSAGDILHTLHEHRTALEMVLGQPVKVYMPPRNVINHRTHGVLEQAGFDWYTTGPETDRWAVDHSRALRSQGPWNYGRSDELLRRDQAPARLMAASEAGVNPILTLHWTWEVNIGLEHLERFLTEIPNSYFWDFYA
jgi:hypothetical protein